MQVYGPLELERIAFHINTLLQKQQAIPKEVQVIYRGRSHVLCSLMYEKRYIYAELIVAANGIVFKTRLTKAELADIVLDALSQAEPEDMDLIQKRAGETL